MEKGFKVWRHRSVVPVGLITAGLITSGLITASAVIGLPGRTEQNALSPVVQRRVATVILAQRIRLRRDGPSPQPLPRAEGIVVSA